MPTDLFDLLAVNAWSLPTADGVSLHVTELGSGAPVVVLHGGPGAHYAYLVDAVRRSVDRGRFVLFDQRGSRQRSRSMHWNRQAAIAIDGSLPETYDVRPTLRTHPVPISVIQGDHDYLDPGASSGCGSATNTRKSTSLSSTAPDTTPGSTTPKPSTEPWPPP